MKTLKAPDLHKLYTEADDADKKAFAEMRSNVLLIAGEHYTKKNARIFNRIRDAKGISDEQKIRLTKNHIQRIIKHYCDHILTAAPGVIISPQNPKEIEDQKTAELCQSVWAYGKHKLKIDEKVSDWCDDFFGIGEVGAKLYFNPDGGDFVGFEQEVSNSGEPVFDEDGSPTASGRAVFRGQVEIESFHGFNLLRDPSAKSLSDSAYYILRKMSDKKDVLNKLDPDDPEFERKKSAIEDGADESFVIFDPQKRNYEQGKGQVLVKEYYFKKCPEYPKGYFYITAGKSDGVVLFEGELPFGIFPIVVECCDKAPTYPRGISPVRTARPYQIEINRGASKIAEHQVTLGDDKLVTMAGATVSQGKSLPGIRHLEVNGPQPTILPGRSGEQFVGYVTSQISELYAVMMVNELSAEKDGQLDPYALLFRSASQKKQFKRYISRFERFMKSICGTFIELQQKYLPEDELIPIIGRREMVNVAEFKAIKTLSYRIMTEAMSEDVETKLGRQLVLNHALQFIGNKLEKDDIGRIIRAMPYAGDEGAFDSFTIDSDAATNTILALDRGEMPYISKRFDKVYMIKRISARTMQADFPFLSPDIQQKYKYVTSEYDRMIEEEQAQILAANAEYIPTDGPLVTVEFYVEDPLNPAHTRRAKLPTNSLGWLIKRIEAQGANQQQLELLQRSNLAEISRAVTANAHGSGIFPGNNANGNVIPGVMNGSRSNFNPSLIGAPTTPS